MNRLLIVTNQPAPYRVDFFRYLQKYYSEEYDIWILFSTDNSKSNRSWSAEENKLKNVVYPKSKVIKFNSNYENSQTVITYGVSKKIDQINPDIVVCMEYNYTSLIVKHWCNKHKVPFISWSDGTRFSERNIKFYQKWFRRYIFKGTAAFIASSLKTRENQIYLGAPEDKIFLSTLAVDISKYDGAGRNYEPNGELIAVGRLVQLKGIDLLLNALSEIKDKSWRLRLIGSGPDRENIENIAREYDIYDRVIFDGYVTGDDLTRKYEKSGIFVFPTRDDCFGLVTLEAMCCGLPSISSKYAGSAYDLIDEEKTGLIVDPYDKKSFASAICKLLDDKEYCKKMSKAAKEKSYEFGFDKTVVGFMDAVRSV
ncbi:Glycosyl transferases group 1 [Lachnospiraceae bacterium]|nr:Glycosyl transferases group 1 [Lachnospiraceae bacterium]